MCDDEEKLQLRTDVERLKRQVRQKDEMIEELEYDLSKVSKTNGSDEQAELRLKDLSNELMKAQVEVENRNEVISGKENEISKLRTEIEALETSNRELANRSIFIADETSNDSLVAEFSKMSEELSLVKNEKNKLLEESLGLNKELILMKEELESTRDHIKHLENSSKEKSEEIRRLESEIFDLRNDGPAMASRGNSIFAEAMDAERKLEEDLKVLFKEKRCLESMVKRLTDEKEDAEQRARNAMNRGMVVKNKISEVDFIEMQKLRKDVQKLETERTIIWDRFFAKAKSASRRELGELIAGYIDSFRVSHDSVKGLQKETHQRINELVVQNHVLNNENEQLKSRCEQLKYDKDTLERKLERQRSIVATIEVPKPHQTPASKKIDFMIKQPATGRPSSFFHSAIVSNNVVSKGASGLEMSMNKVKITPQKPAETSSFATPRIDGNDENMSDWAAKRLAKKAEKEKPKMQYKYVPLKLAVPNQTFKPATLQPKSSSAENADTK